MTVKDIQIHQITFPFRHPCAVVPTVPLLAFLPKLCSSPPSRLSLLSTSVGTVGIYFLALSRFVPPIPAPYVMSMSVDVGRLNGSISEGSIVIWFLLPRGYESDSEGRVIDGADGVEV